MDLMTNADVCRELKVGKNKAWEIIRRLNEELAEKGYMTVRGKVPRKYFEERFYR